MIVELTNGATFAFPPHLVEGLRDASSAEIAEVEVIGAGFGLHWESLDLDYTVPGLVNGIFGTAKWMAARAGRVAHQPRRRRRGRTASRAGGRGRLGEVGVASFEDSDQQVCQLPLPRSG